MNSRSPYKNRPKNAPSLSLEQDAWGKDNVKDILEMLSNKPQYGIFLPEIGNNYLLENLYFRFKNGSNDVTADQILNLITVLYKSESFDKFSTACLAGSIYLEMKNFEEALGELENIENSDDLTELKNLAGILQSFGYNLDIEPLSQAGESLLKIIEDKYLDENNFRKMYMKPFAPQRHIPMFMGEDSLDHEAILDLIKQGQTQLTELCNSETALEIIKTDLQTEIEEDFSTWASMKTHLSKRESIIIDDRVSRLYKERVDSKIKVEARVKEISKEGLWLQATDEEKATHGRAKGTTPDSKVLFQEFANDEKKIEQMSAFAIHDIDLEQALEAEIRIFNSADGNVEMFTPHEFSDSPVEYKKFNSLKTVAVAKAHIAFRTKKEWLKNVPLDDLKPGIYDLEFATVTSKKKN